jgi:hypothetical protein
MEICVDEPAGLGPEADDSENDIRLELIGGTRTPRMWELIAQRVQEAVTSPRSGEESSPDRLKELE